MGSTLAEAFPDLVTLSAPVFDHSWDSGTATKITELPVMTSRNGYIEETYFEGSIIPIRDSDGMIGGFYNATMEVTTQKVIERRRAMLEKMDVPSKLHGGSTLASYIIEALESNPIDITMALLYEIDEETMPSLCRVHLRGRIGVPEGHPIAVEEADLKSEEGLIPILRQAGTHILTLPVNEKFKGVEWCGFNEPSSHFSVVPIAVAERSFGFLVVGANSRRLIDELHISFMEYLGMKTSAIAASSTYYLTLMHISHMSYLLLTRFIRPSTVKVNPEPLALESLRHIEEKA